MPAWRDRLAASLLLILPLGCVEIDPSYGESYSTSASSSATGTSSTDPLESSSSGDPTCDCGPWQLCEAGACTEPARILFVNLDEVTTTNGPPDASMNVQALAGELSGTWSGYSDDEAERQALMDIITAQWAPFRVLVTDQRPDASAAPYMMAIVTSDPPPPEIGPTVWFAYPDCGDLDLRDIAFVFMAPGNGYDTQAHANFTSGAIARTFGILRTSSTQDIAGGGSQFVDACSPLSGDPPCPMHPQMFCDGDIMQQNSFRELETLFGLRAE